MSQYASSRRRFLLGERERGGERLIIRFNKTHLIKRYVPSSKPHGPVFFFFFPVAKRVIVRIQERTTNTTAPSNKAKAHFALLAASVVD